MKKEILKYFAGLCQAWAAALLASALIMPNIAGQAILGSVVVAFVGLILIILKEV